MENNNKELDVNYWKRRCLAAENVMKCSTLVQPLNSKNPSYQFEWYVARKVWQDIQKELEDGHQSW